MFIRCYRLVKPYTEVYSNEQNNYQTVSINKMRSKF